MKELSKKELSNVVPASSQICEKIKIENIHDTATEVLCHDFHKYFCTKPTCILLSH